MTLVEEAETLLARRELRPALLAFDRAEGAGADPDRCCGGRWMALMLAGEYKAAWRQSDAILARGNPDPHRFWTGQDVQEMRGKRVMVRSLHGFGDAVQMLRYAPKLLSLAGSVVYEVAPDLLPLMPCFTGVTEAITWGADAPALAPAWDLQMEVMELPYLFRTGMDDLPVAAKYVTVPEDAAALAAAAMGNGHQVRVGVCSSASDWDPRRNLIPAQVEPLLAVEGVEFWSLDRTGGLSGNPQLRSVRDACGDGLVPLAAAIAEFDLVITVDTLAAHLAGAMGTPVWLMLQHAADWRWMAGIDHSPWYPGMRLYRQPSAGDWGSVLNEVLRDLATWVLEAKG